MAGRHSPLSHSKRGKAYTTNHTSLTLGVKAAVLIVKLHYLFLAPWIVLVVPSQVFLGLGILIVLIVGFLGLYGMSAKKQAFTILASVMLLVSLVAGKAGTDLTRASSPDTAVLLLQLVAILFFMEASRVVLSFDKEMGELAGRTDDMSQVVRCRLAMWVTGQLSRQARLMIGALGLSLVLLVLGGFTSVSINQPALSAILVLLVVGALLFVITQRREPETRQP